MKSLSLLLVLSILILFQCCSTSKVYTSLSSIMVQDSGQIPYMRFLTEPNQEGCYKNKDRIDLEVDLYRNGVIDTSYNGPVYLFLTPYDPSIPLDPKTYFEKYDGSQNSISTGYLEFFATAGKVIMSVDIRNGEKRKYEFNAGLMKKLDDCEHVYSCPFDFCPPSGSLGDPQFIGLQGQSYQVHGRPDTLFNLISYPSHGFTVNSEFVYLSNGQCTYNTTECWSHPGTYNGKIGILLNNETTLMILSGPHNQGLQVYLKNKHIKASDLPEELTKNDYVHFIDYDRVYVHTIDFGIEIVNSDNFLNLEVKFFDKNLLAYGNSKNNNKIINSDLDGLLGQTWLNKQYVSSNGISRPYKGSVDDYIVDSPFDFLKK